MGLKGMQGWSQRKRLGAAVDTLASNLFEQRTGLLDLPGHHGERPLARGSETVPSPSASALSADAGEASKQADEPNEQPVGGGLGYDAEGKRGPEDCRIGAVVSW